MSRLHVIFDLDDTLYPERQYAIEGFRSAGRWAEQRFGVKGLDVEMTQMLDAGMLGKLFATVLARHVPDHTPEDVKAFHEAYRQVDEPVLTLFSDAAEALAHYENRGPIGLITDGTQYVQRKKVRALGLEPRFAKIVFTGALGENREFHKPHPRSYELIEEAIGAPGDRYAYIGDNPAKDFVAPNAMGWISVLVHRDAPRIHDVQKVAAGGEPQHTIASLTDLRDVLGE
ncbi:MAG: HAD family hydrolase [Proteobacteria bacterium]|nr:HAD family hydrolase [Pseudomonadota bacterium]